MKQHLLNALKRGLLAASGGPLVLAIVYGALGATGAVSSFTPNEVCLGILTVTLMAFIAAAVGVVYEIERLPLLPATAIHASALYLDYLLIYLLNNWLPRASGVIAMFTVIFAAVYAIIWLTVFAIIRLNTRRLNEKIKGC